MPVPRTRRLRQPSSSSPASGRRRQPPMTQCVCSMNPCTTSESSSKTHHFSRRRGCCIMACFRSRWQRKCTTRDANSRAVTLQCQPRTFYPRHCRFMYYAVFRSLAHFAVITLLQTLMLPVQQVAPVQTLPVQSSPFRPPPRQRLLSQSQSGAACLHTL
jgi:hypothetical protein